MTKRTAVLQTSSEPRVALEALDIALALASMDQPVQLMLVEAAIDVLKDSPSKRYAMLELLDAEPILLVSNENSDETNDESIELTTELDVELLHYHQLRETLDTFDQVLQFS